LCFQNVYSFALLELYGHSVKPSSLIIQQPEDFSMIQRLEPLHIQGNFV